MLRELKMEPLKRPRPSSEILFGSLPQKRSRRSRSPLKQLNPPLCPGNPLNCSRSLPPYSGNPKPLISSNHSGNPKPLISPNHSGKLLLHPKPLILSNHSKSSAFCSKNTNHSEKLLLHPKPLILSSRSDSSRKLFNPSKLEILLAPRVYFPPNEEKFENFEDVVRVIRSGEDEPRLLRYNNLCFLNLPDCELIRSMDVLKGCRKLKSVNLKGCSKLITLPLLDQCPSLENLNLSGCPLELWNSPSFSRLKSLVYLNMTGNSWIVNLLFLSECTSLSVLILNECKSLSGLSGLVECSNITVLSLKGCSSLRTLFGVEKLRNLEKLNITRCESLTSIQYLYDLPSLV